MFERTNRWSLFLFALLLTARATAQTVTLEEVRVDHLDGQSYTFTPGGNNVLPTTRVITFRNRTAEYTPVASFNATASPIVQCDEFDNVPENSNAGALTSLGVSSNPQQSNVALRTAQFTIEMPPRGIGGQPGFPARAIQPGEPEREVVYTFACTLGTTAGFETGPRSDIVVRQQLDPAVQSVTATAVSPDPALFLTPGSRQTFTVMADWEENTFTPLSGKLRLSVLDSAGNELTPPRLRSLARMTNNGLSTTSGSQELSISATVPSDGIVVLKTEMIEQLTINRELVTTGPWAKAENIVYQADDSLSLRNPLPVPGPSIPLLSFTTVSFEVQADYSLDSADQAEIVPLLVNSEGKELARGPAVIVSKGGGTVELQILSFELIELGEMVFLQALMQGSDGTLIARSQPIEYAVEALTCPALSESLSPLSPKSQDKKPCVPPPDYSVLHIDAIQVVQDHSNLIPLVANKRTIISILIAAKDLPKGDQGPRVPIDVTIRRCDKEQAGRCIGDTVVERTVADFPRPDAGVSERSSLRATVFLTPFTAPAGTIEVEVVANRKRNCCSNFSVAREQVRDNNMRTRRFQFRKTARVDIEYLLVCDASGKCPAEADVANADTLLRFLAPVATRNGVSYSAFDLDPFVTPGRKDFADLVGRLAVFLVGRLVDYVVLWVDTEALFFGEGSQEGIALGALRNNLGRLGIPALVEIAPDEPKDMPGLLAGEFPVVAGVLPNTGSCPLASNFSSVSTIGWGPFAGGGFLLDKSIGDLHPSCAAEKTVWISSGVYTALFNRQAGRASAALRPEAVEQSAIKNYFLVSGTTDRTGGSISPVLRASLPLPTPSLPQTGDVCAESQSNGASLARQCLRRSSSTLDEEPFVFLLPYDEQADRIVLFVGDQQADVRSAGANPPVVNIVSPVTGATIDAADPFTLSWNGTDADGDLLEFTVLYSSDGGVSWLPLRLDLAQSSASIDITQIAGGESVFFRVLATDAFHTGEATVGPVNVLQTPRVEADAIVDLGTTPADLALQGDVPIRSTGTGALTVLSVDSDNPAFVPQAAFSLRIKAGSSRNVPLEFTPNGAGPASATLTVRSDEMR